MRIHPCKQTTKRLSIITLLVVLFLAACQPQQAASPDAIAVASLVETALASSPTPGAVIPTEESPTDEPKAAEPVTTVEPLLPAPLYFISDINGSSQLWRIEMNGGFANLVIDSPAVIFEYDISPLDGRLAYVSDNDLYIAGPDGSDPERVVDGEDYDPQKGYDPSKTVGSPVWSPDGKELAYSFNGVNIRTLETGAVRTLNNNVVADNDNIGAFRAYYPTFWSPGGDYIAAQVGYYEGSSLIILPAQGGEPVELDVCCEMIQAEDPDSFYVTSATMGYGVPGFWKVNWKTGETTTLSAEPVDSVEMATYSHALLSTGGLLYFFQGLGRAAMIASAVPDSLLSVNVISDFAYMPSDALWAPDAGLVVVNGRRPEQPMQIWFSSGEQRSLELPGRSLKWGVATEADIAFAGTPAPPPAPPVPLPLLPENAQPITAGNVTQLQVLSVMDEDEDVYSLAISPNGELLALGLTSRVHIWDLSSMQKVAELKPYQDIVPALDFSPDSRFLAVGSWDKSLDIWEMSTFGKIRSFEGHQDWVTEVSFSPDGRFLASASTDDTLIVWDAANGSIVRDVISGSWINDVDYSPDGALLAYAIWDFDAFISEASTGDAFGRIQRPENQWVLNLAFSPDSQTLVLATWNYSVVLYDIATQQERAILSGHSDNPTGMAFNSDGQVLATADEAGELRFWDLNTGSQLHQIQGTRIVGISPDGRLLVTGGERIEGVVLYYVP